MALLDSLNAELLQVQANRATVVANPKPNYAIDGVNYSWAEYYQMLLTQQIIIEEAIQRAGGPFQLVTRVRT